MNLKETATEVLYATLPVTILVTVLQFTIIKLPMDIFLRFIGGAVLLMIGLILFLVGVKVGFLPIGEMIGSAIVKKGKLWLILFFGFVIGFAVTIAEPDLQVLASQVDSVSDSVISKNLLMASVALGVGVFVALALLRMLLNIPIVYLLAGGYALAFLLSLFTPPEFRAVSFDAGGVTTGPMTVPFILALGVGISNVARKRKASDDSFGLVALASIGPILAVLLLGVINQ